MYTDEAQWVPMLRVELARPAPDSFEFTLRTLGLRARASEPGVFTIELPTAPLPRAVLDVAADERVSVPLAALPLAEPYDPSRADEFARPAFNAAQLARLVRSLLERHESASPWRLVALGHATAVHWLHTPDAPLGTFVRSSLSWSPSRVFGPALGPVRAYFGERVALYFGFLESYTRALVWLAAAGALATLVQLARGSVDTGAVPVFAFVTCLWVTLFAENWKRRQARLAAEWGVHGCEQHERLRPEFVGELERGFFASPRLFVPASMESTRASVLAAMDSGLAHGGGSGGSGGGGEPGSLDASLVAAALAIHERLEASETAHVPAPIVHVPHFPASERRRRLVGSAAVVVLALGLVVAGMLALMVFRLVLMRTAFLGPTGGGIVGGCLNALYITAMNHAYGRVARRLTEWENHATQTAFDDSQITKTFAFMFVNSYSSLFYLAFGKAWLSFGGLERGCAPSCLAELSTQLGSILISSVVVGNLRELGLPVVLAWVRHARARGSLARAASERRDTEGLLDGDDAQSERGGGGGGDDGAVRARAAPLAPITDTDHIAEYAELVIQLGYVTMFAAAFPAAPLVALANNLVEHRVDLFKLARVSYRAPPASAEDIGAWLGLVVFIGYASVVTNLALLTVTSSALRTMVADAVGAPVDSARVIGLTVLVAVVGEHVLLGLKYVLAAFIADVPDDVTRRLALEAHVLELRRVERRTHRRLGAESGQARAPS